MGVIAAVIVDVHVNVIAHVIVDVIVDVDVDVDVDVIVDGDVPNGSRARGRPRRGTSSMPVGCVRPARDTGSFPQTPPRAD